MNRYRQLMLAHNVFRSSDAWYQLPVTSEWSTAEDKILCEIIEKHVSKNIALSKSNREKRASQQRPRRLSQHSPLEQYSASVGDSVLFRVGVNMTGENNEEERLRIRFV